MAVMKVSVLSLFLCLLSQWTYCQEQAVWSSHSVMTIDSVDFVTFRCPHGPHWKLQPGSGTMAFVEGVSGLREFYSKCIGSTNCTISRSFIWRLYGQRPQSWLRPEDRVGARFIDELLLSCASVEYFHGINSTNRKPLTISNLHWSRGYIYTTGTESMELNPNITITNPDSVDIEIHLYYLYDSAEPDEYKRMVIEVQGPGTECVLLDHSVPRRWITTNMKSMRISFSSCSRSGRFGIGYFYHLAPGQQIPKRLVVMDGTEPLTGQHNCSQRQNNCPQRPPTATSTTRATVLHTVSSSGSSPLSSTLSTPPNVLTAIRGTVPPVTHDFPDVTGQSGSPAPNTSPDVTREVFVPNVNTSATRPQRAEQPGIGVVVGGSVAGGILLAVIVILILVLLLRKRGCLKSKKQPDSPQRIDSQIPTAPGMQTLLRGDQQRSTASPAAPQPVNAPPTAPRPLHVMTNAGNAYAVVNKGRRQPPPRPPRAIYDNNLQSPPDVVPEHTGVYPSASIFIVENDGYDSVLWGGGP